MLFNPKDIHIVLIGHEKGLDYRINLELLRTHFSFGQDLWITTVYNGDPNNLVSGVGENTFIHIPKNRGYCYGAMDAINKGLSFAVTGNRPIIALFNFDVWFYKENGFKLWVEEFLESGKRFGAGFLPDHYLPMTDCMIFQKDYLDEILPISEQVYFGREQDEKLKQMYDGTQLGFNNVEEFLLNTLMVNCHKTEDCFNEIEKIWFKFQRDGAPRYRFTEKFTLGHIHDYEERYNHLIKYISDFSNLPVTKSFIDHIKGNKS